MGNGKELLIEVEVSEPHKRRKDELDDEVPVVADERTLSVVCVIAPSHFPEGKAHECDVLTEQWTRIAIVLDLLDNL